MSRAMWTRRLAARGPLAWNTVAGAIFLAAGAVMALTGNQTWVVFLVLGITFLGMGAGGHVRESSRPAPERDQAPPGPERDEEPSAR